MESNTAIIEVVEGLATPPSEAFIDTGKMLAGAKDFLFLLLPKIFSSLIILVIGIVAIKLIMKLTEKALTRSKLDVTLHRFIHSTVKIILYVLLLITCANMLGIPITSLLTALGAIGLAVSLAVKDSLTNIAGGMLILITKPFVVGDFVDIGAKAGVVSEIGLVYTVLKTIDNKRIYVPNGDVAKSNLTNFTSEPLRRLDLIFSISYHDNVEEAKSIIIDILQESKYPLLDPAPIVRVCEHADHSVKIACKVWVESGSYWDLNYDMYEQVKERFDAAGITIPYQQMEVRLVDSK